MLYLYVEKVEKSCRSAVGEVALLFCIFFSSYISVFVFETAGTLLFHAVIQFFILVSSFEILVENKCGFKLACRYFE